MEEQYITKSPYDNKRYFKDKAKTILHRLDEPAVEHANGDKAWYINDVFIFRLNSKGEMTDRMT